jgi:hypothetical protein
MRERHGRAVLRLSVTARSGLQAGTEQVGAFRGEVRKR